MKKATLFGAIAGDVIGSAYEFRPTKDYNFTLLDEWSDITDDSIMTIAVADWILSAKDAGLTAHSLTSKMQHWGRKYRYPMGGYGGMFGEWLGSECPQPYNSWGNGSAMRVSACGFAFDTLEQTLEAAKASAEVTHNHPEGIKGAQATAAAIFLARTGHGKEEIRDYIGKTFGYDLNRTCDVIRADYSFEPSCQETVPQSLIAFLDSKGYEDAIRLAVSLGGDADTMGAITGAVAIAYYKEMPDEIHSFAMSRLPNDLKDVVTLFEETYTE
ncbi:dinitrogenase reductase [Prevotella sp. PINT]|jgi:ADP-ribosylglycohydrolase|uniref:ADP-ribosylglycohydrolase family protein n=1 Tax=Palleniella intestinalis TaxID=2736291 RepID=UPI00155364AB|nr:ADP-ribosylglycohydrolase family protein [Palleniella intestinalis]NPD82390.1 dinitrogenase reductase [Palleniella intestinalis]